MKRRHAAGGFTLIELLIVMVVLGILAAIAYPSYTSHMRKSRRAEAQQVLMDAFSRQQQRLLDTRSYTVSAGRRIEDTGTALPAGLTGLYTFAMDPSTATTFSLTAAPAGAQLGDSCGTLSIDHQGDKRPANCW